MVPKSRRGRARLGKRKKKIFAVKSVLVFLMTLSFIAILVWLLRLPQVNISKIEISGNAVITENSIKEIAQSELSGTYLFLIPRSNILFYPKRRISSSIEGELIRIKDVTVSNVDLETIAIDIRERVPFGLWCGFSENEPVSDESISDCYFLDKEGYLFAKSPNFSGDVFFRYYGLLSDQASTTDPLGTRFLPVDQFLGYTLFFDALRNLEVNPVVLIRYGVSDLRLPFEYGGSILFSTEQNLNTILLNFRAIIESATFSSGGMKGVEYIDLRYGNKVFYKPVK